MNKILVVDDELSIRESFTLILEGKYQVTTAASGEAALKHVADQAIDLAYLDVRMPGLDGLETLQRLKAIDPALEVVMVTAVNDVRKASEAIQLGARDYLIKPFDVEAILRMTERIISRKALAEESSTLVNPARPPLIGQSEKVAAVMAQAKKIAAQETRVLIQGEPGTEKEEIARLIHQNSSRRELPFQRFYLSADLPAESVQARLYGRDRGVTTIELKKESGLLAETRGGTLFLSHLEYLAHKPVAGPVRLIGASDRSNLADVNREIFDHFAEAVITLPPLRARLGDLPLLVERYLALFNRRHGRRVTRIAAAALEVMSGYHWPGNTLELRLLIERLVLKADNEEISVDDLPLEILLRSGAAYGRDYPAAFEKSYIRKVREVSGLDRTGLAALLQV
jgi:DNA-binding NtrC family response regulator